MLLGDLGAEVIKVERLGTVVHCYPYCMCLFYQYSVQKHLRMLGNATVV